MSVCRPGKFEITLMSDYWLSWVSDCRINSRQPVFVLYQYVSANALLWPDQFPIDSTQTTKVLEIKCPDHRFAITAFLFKERLSSASKITYSGQFFLWNVFISFSFVLCIVCWAQQWVVIVLYLCSIFEFILHLFMKLPDFRLILRKSLLNKFINLNK